MGFQKLASRWSATLPQIVAPTGLEHQAPAEFPQAVILEPLDQFRALRPAHSAPLTPWNAAMRCSSARLDGTSGSAQEAGLQGRCPVYQLERGFTPETRRWCAGSARTGFDPHRNGPSLRYHADEGPKSKARNATVAWRSESCGSFSSNWKLVSSSCTGPEK